MLVAFEKQIFRFKQLTSQPKNDGRVLKIMVLCIIKLVLIAYSDM